MWVMKPSMFPDKNSQAYRPWLCSGWNLQWELSGETRPRMHQQHLFCGIAELPHSTSTQKCSWANISLAMISGVQLQRSLLPVSTYIVQKLETCLWLNYCFRVATVASPNPEIQCRLHWLWHAGCQKSCKCLTELLMATQLYSVVLKLA